MIQNVHLISPRGFCFGVKRALALLDKALPLCPYVLHEIVHNKQIVQAYQAKGVHFVVDLKDVPDGATVVFSAHGVSKDIEALAKSKNLNIIDTTCPFVQKVHRHVERLQAEGKAVLLIGKKGHAETCGTLGRLHPATQAFLIETKQDIPEGLSAVGVATQTTLSVDETADIVASIQRLYPAAEFQNDICQATTERQKAVKEALCDCILVVGDVQSSNAKRLVEVARQSGKQAYLIETKDELEKIKLSGRVGITAAASAPEEIVQAVYAALQNKSRLRP